MKKNRLKLSVIILVFFKFGLYAQTININYTDGSHNTYNLLDIRKITFSNDSLNLKLWDGTLYSWNINNISYCKYDEVLLGIENLLNKVNEQQIVVFPNPFSNELQIKINLPYEDDLWIGIYDQQGEILLNKKICVQPSKDYQAAFNLSNLSAGNYVCRLIGQNCSISKKVIKY
jgi:hypothetical protein